MTIGIVSSKSSNIGSLLKILKRMPLSNIDVLEHPDASILETTDYIILPGVSSFDASVRSLRDNGFYEYIKSFKKNSGKGVVGICAGAQVLFESSEEGSQEGIGLLPGRVRKISPKNNILLPHIGWNHIRPSKKRESSIYIDQEKPFYFCHSYRFPDSKNTVAYTDYGETFPSIVSDGQVTAIQFHPEKSYSQGLELLKSIISRSYVKAKNNTSIATV
ncbi:MAG: imidazole glycerol phosphate synthase subunit HisH [Alphaproteobacteria bacterium]|nr:MAG: imidazole glycerol phosphate synthase subunit HisH [Alphaproteobacteria bacterium]